MRRNWRWPVAAGTAMASLLVLAWSPAAGSVLSGLPQRIDPRLNGCGLGGHYWFFAGGLSNVQTVIIDTATGATRRYRNPANTTFQPIEDTAAFATCP